MADPEQELAKAKADYEKAKAQAKARYDKAKARHETAARKQDTRRKVILGGAMVELASRDGEMHRLLVKIIDGLSRDQDRKVFDGWSAPGEDFAKQDAPPDDASGGQNDGKHRPRLSDMAQRLASAQNAVARHDAERLESLARKPDADSRKTGE